MCAADAELVISQLFFQIPWVLTAELRRIQCQLALALRPVAGGAHGVGRRAERRIARWPCLNFGKGRLAVHPRLVVLGLVNHNPAAHGVMCDTTQLFAENFIFTHFGRFQPHVRHHARH